MKIIHVIPSISVHSGGPIEGVVQLSSILSSLGHEVTVVSCGSSAVDSPLFHPSVKVLLLGPSYLKYKFSFNLIPWLKDNLHNYDAAIINGLWQFPGLALFIASLNNKIPYFVFTHGMLDPWFKKRYPLKHLKKLIYWNLFEYRILRDAKSVIFTCKEEGLLAAQSFAKYDVRESICAYGISPPPSSEAKLAKDFLLKFPNLINKKLILFMGRIHEKKGCDLLIEAFSSIADRDSSLHLVICGPDSSGLMAQLKLKSIKLKIEDRVTWTGIVVGDLKWGAFYAADIFCLPSHQENFGIVVAEALACSKPVLISNKVNIWREIQACDAGFVEDDTLQGTIQLFENWLNADEIVRAKMRLNALKCYKNNFSISSAASSLLKIITP